MLLPKLSGAEVLRALRKNPCTQKTPIIVLSGLSQTNESKLKADGADAYFEKSSLNFDKDDGKSIIQTVQRMLSKDPKKDADRLAHT